MQWTKTSIAIAGIEDTLLEHMNACVQLNIFIGHAFLHISKLFKRAGCPTGPFTVLKPRDEEIGEFYEVQKRRATDFKALKLRKGRSGG